MPEQTCEKFELCTEVRDYQVEVHECSGYRVYIVNDKVFKIEKIEN